MGSSSIQAFRQTVTVAWPAKQDAAARALLVRTARAGHARIMADAKSRSGSEPQWEVYANAPGNTSLDLVKLPGPIVYRYRYFTEVVQAALTALQKASPVRSGLYAKSHTVYVNGQPVAGVPKGLKSTDQVMIANPVPYARRIEIGKTQAGRDFVIQVPNRIYERVVKKVLMPKFGKVAKITFGYVSLPGGGELKSRAGHGGAKRKRAAGVGAMAPAIFIGGQG